LTLARPRERKSASKSKKSEKIAIWRAKVEAEQRVTVARLIHAFSRVHSLPSDPTFALLKRNRHFGAKIRRVLQAVSRQKVPLVDRTLERHNCSFINVQKSSASP
jgi:hypothetical protein